MWMNGLTTWHRFIKLTAFSPEKQIHVFPAFLTGTALDWYHNLMDNEQPAMACMLQSFHSRFKQSAEIKANHMRRVFNTSQDVGQSVLDYVTVMQTLARGLNIPENMQVDAIVAGLHPSVASFVKQHCPTSITEIIQCPAATLIATSNIPSGENMDNFTEDVAAQVLQELQPLLSAHVSTTTAAAALPYRPSRPRFRHDARQYSPSRTPSYDRYHNQRRWKQPHPSSPSYRDRRRPKRLWNAPYPRSHPHAPSRQYYNRRYTNQTSEHQHPCTRCGKSYLFCNGENWCIAKNRACYNCKRVGHFYSQCWNDKINK